MPIGKLGKLCYKVPKLPKTFRGVAHVACNGSRLAPEFRDEWRSNCVDSSGACRCLACLSPRAPSRRGAVLTIGLPSASAPLSHSAARPDGGALRHAPF